MFKKAVFLDRDGVINQRRDDYVKNVTEFEIYDGVANAIALLKKNNYLVIVVTNQSAIGRKLLSINVLEEIHKKLENYLKENGTFLDRIYFCPHLPEDKCKCRKPKPGLLIQASHDYGIDLKNSLLIGDSKTDAEAAKAVKCRWVLLEKGQNLLQIVEKFTSREKTIKS